MAKLKLILTGGDDAVTRLESGHAEAEKQLGTARQALQRAIAKREELIAEALDGTVSPDKIEQHRDAISQARLQVEEGETMVRLLEERLQKARQDAIAKTREKLVKQYLAEAAKADSAIEEANDCAARGPAALRRALDSFERMRAIAPAVDISAERFPDLWKPIGLVGAWTLELVRQEPELMRFYPESVARSNRSFLESHRREAAALQPTAATRDPDPEPPPQAA